MFDNITAKTFHGMTLELSKISQSQRVDKNILYWIVRRITNYMLEKWVTVTTFEDIDKLAEIHPYAYNMYATIDDCTFTNMIIRCHQTSYYNSIHGKHYHTVEYMDRCMYALKLSPVFFSHIPEELIQ
jgi:hypothetical protein